MTCPSEMLAISTSAAKSQESWQGFSLSEESQCFFRGGSHHWDWEVFTELSLGRSSSLFLERPGRARLYLGLGIREKDCISDPERRIVSKEGTALRLVASGDEWYPGPGCAFLARPPNLGWKLTSSFVPAPLTEAQLTF